MNQKAHEPLILYSTVTQLAYHVAQHFYSGTHYAWCAPAPSADAFVVQNPPSSDPISLYWRYKRDIDGGDSHSDLIARQRRGIARGAVVKAELGIISADERSQIEGMAQAAPLGDFRPLLFVMPYSRVRNLARPASLDDRARASSREFIVEALPRDCFDVLRLEED